MVACEKAPGGTLRFFFLFSGIFLGTIFEATLIKIPSLWSGIGCFISVVVGVGFYKRKLKMGVCLAFLLIGIFSFSLRHSFANHQELSGQTYLEKRKGEQLELTIIDKVKELGEYRIYSGELREDGKKVYLYGLRDGFKSGELIRGRVKYKTPPFKRNFGDMDYKKYLNSKGIYMWLTLVGEPERVGFNPYCIAAMPIRVRNLFEEKIDKYMIGEPAALSKAMLLGDTKFLSEDLSEAFRNGGVSHVLSVSGLHVGYFYILFNYLFKGAKKRKGGKLDVSVLLPIGITFLYVILSGLQAPAIRSFLMFSIPKVGTSLFGQERGGRKDYLALPGIMMLMSDPFLIYDVGFLISFSCIFAMGEITFGIKKKVNPLFQLVLMSTAAWLGSLPFILWSFGRVSVAGLLSNIPIIPISGISTIVGILAILTSFFSKVIGSLLFFLTSTLMELLTSITKGFAEAFPIFVIPRLPFMIIGALTAAILYRFSKVKKGVYQNWIVGLIITAACVQGAFMVYPFGKIEIDFLDVGQGDSAIIKLPKGGQLLVDGGSDEDFLIGVLNKMGFFKIDTVLITHEHSDHAKGAIKAIETYRPRRVILPKHEATEQKEQRDGEAKRNSEDHWLEVKALQEKIGFEIIEVGAGDVMNVGGTTLEVLLPDGETQSKEDENSAGIVFLLSYKDLDCLFTADAGIEEEEVYCKQLIGRKIEVLKVPHHGSKYSSGEKLLNQVEPLLCVVSVGKNLYGHPSARVLDNFASLGAAVYRTDRCGAIRLYSNGKTYKVQTVR